MLRSVIGYLPGVKEERKETEGFGGWSRELAHTKCYICMNYYPCGGNAVYSNN